MITSYKDAMSAKGLRSQGSVSSKSRLKAVGRFDAGTSSYGGTTSINDGEFKLDLMDDDD